MKIQTFSIITGTAACNASCPYCISKMTGIKKLGFKEPKVNWRNFQKACRLASMNTVSTVLLTGKGEPTLYPAQITRFLKNMKPFDFPLIELQTNGLVFGKEFKKCKRHLEEWYRLGLTMIAISVVHYKKEKNKEIFTPSSEYIDLGHVINDLHKIGFSVRLSCTMIKGYVDSLEEAKKMIGQAREWKVEQLSLRKLAKPLESENKSIFSWTAKHTVSKGNLDRIASLLEKNGNKLMTLAHGSAIYDLEGQNVCLTDALTIEPESDDLRQIIFFPDGRLRFDWQFKGAVLI